jgi:hypothetical protein
MQSVHHAFIKLKAGDFVPADANFIPGRLVPFSRSAGLQHRGGEGTFLRGGSPPAGARRLTASAAALSPTVFSPRR